MAHLPQNTPILLLKEGTDTSQGKGQLLSNITACVNIADVVRTTLGPRGMDKIIEDGRGGNIITNDGATILTELDIAHPAAHTMVQIAQSQDAEVGDGTTSVVLIAGALLAAARPFVEDNVHPATIIKAYRRATDMAVAKISELKVTMAPGSEEHRDMLVKCANTTLNSKLIGGKQGMFFANMTVEAVQSLDEDLPLEMIGVKKVHGGALEDTQLVLGVAFKRSFTFAGFEQQPKRIENPNVLCLNLELELRAEKDNAEVTLKDPSEYQRIVDAEWKILYDKLDACVNAGANVVLSQVSIGDVATQYFADRGIFSAGRVPRADIERVLHATGGTINTTVSGLTSKALGSCGLFEERQVGSERYNFLTGCPKTTTATIILRGGAEQFIEEAVRSLHDAIMIVRRAVKTSSIVAGGGAIEMELSKYLHDEALKIVGKEQLMVSAFAKALETIPRQLCENAGFDATDILNELRQAHQEGAIWAGVDIENEGVTDCLESKVWLPSINVSNSLRAASECATLILSIDESVKIEKSQVPTGGPARG